MTNVEQYLNRDKNTCVAIPKRVSNCLQVDNFLSEYNTDEERELAMLNLLLLDNTPREGSTRLLTSGVIFRVLLDYYTKVLIDQKLLELRDAVNNGYTKEQIDQKLQLLQNVIDSIYNNVYNKEQINYKLLQLLDNINNIRISLDDLTLEEIDRLKGKSAYEIYLETVPQGLTPMTKQEWIASLLVDYSIINEYINLLVNERLSRLFNHVFLTPDEYNSLQEKDPNTLYFKKVTWKFGDKFPASFTSQDNY